jgi:signal peptidase I
MKNFMCNIKKKKLIATLVTQLTHGYNRHHYASMSTSDTPTPSTESVSISSTPPPKHSFIGEILNFALLALIVVLPIRMFVAQPFIVSGASMETTFSTGQYLIVDQVSYRFEEPRRGEVIIFRYPKDPSKFFIKRIIGIPGDTVTVKGNAVTITNAEQPEGVTLEEPYILDMAPTNNITETLGEGEYFVMGDNRDASSDSRMWGVLQRDKIIGRAFLRLYPFTKAGIFPGAYDITEEINKE